MQPFMGKLEFLMSGDELTESHHCGGLKGKFFEIESGGSLELYGNHPRNMWGTLRQTAERGAYSLFIQGQMDWEPNDQVIIGTTGADASETEWLTIFAKRYIPNGAGGWDTEINVILPLQFRHVAVTEQHGLHTIDMRCEVGLFLRPHTGRAGPAYSSIRIAGVDNNHWDFRFRSMALSYLGMLFIARRGSTVTMEGVRVEDGGTHKPGLVALRRSVGGPRNVIPMIHCWPGATCHFRRNVIVPRRGHGIETWSGHVERNVFWQSMTGLKIGGNAVAMYNAVYGSTSRPGSLLADGSELTESDTGIDWMDCGRRLVVIGNTVPGAQSVCMQAGAGWCMPVNQFRNNTGHGCLVGFATKGGVSQPIQDVRQQSDLNASSRPSMARRCLAPRASSSFRRVVLRSLSLGCTDHAVADSSHWHLGLLVE
jgi:hypothetical protein